MVPRDTTPNVKAFLQSTPSRYNLYQEELVCRNWKGVTLDCSGGERVSITIHHFGNPSPSPLSQRYPSLSFPPFKEYFLTIHVFFHPVGLRCSM